MKYIRSNFKDQNEFAMLKFIRMCTLKVQSYKFFVHGLDCCYLHFARISCWRLNIWVSVSGCIIDHQSLLISTISLLLKCVMSLGRDGCFVGTSLLKLPLKCLQCG